MEFKLLIWPTDPGEFVGLAACLGEGALLCSLTESVCSDGAQTTSPVSSSFFKIVFFFLLLATNYAHAYSDNTVKLCTFFLPMPVRIFSFGLC